jgi:hypothetical protein
MIETRDHRAGGAASFPVLEDMQFVVRVGRRKGREHKVVRVLKKFGGYDGLGA